MGEKSPPSEGTASLMSRMPCKPRVVVRNYNDSTNAVVYRQSPGASQAPTPMGSDVTLYLTVNPERIPK